jgi:hypothetical protein
MPTSPKVIIFIFLVAITSFFNTASYCPGCTRESYGLPLTHYELPGWDLSGPIPDYRIVYTGLILDLILWYLVSCGVVSLISQKRKSSKK